MHAPYREPAFVLPPTPAAPRVRARVRDADDEELPVPPVAVRAPAPEPEPTWIERWAPAWLVALGMVIAGVIVAMSAR